MAEKPVEKTDKSASQPSGLSLPRSPELMNAEDSALLVVDAQVKLLELIPQRARIVWNIRRLLDAAAALGVPFAATEQYPEKLSPTVPELKERIGDAPNKLCFSACVCGEIFERWRADNRYRVLLTGIESHVCVMQTALDLAAAGFEPYVAVDAVGSRYAIDYEMALRRMESAGVILTTTEAAMFEWCKTSDRAEFKKISALAKESAP
jgi:nicotinamidase-related amidase